MNPKKYFITPKKSISWRYAAQCKSIVSYKILLNFFKPIQNVSFDSFGAKFGEFYEALSVFKSSYRTLFLAYRTRAKIRAGLLKKNTRFLDALISEKFRKMLIFEPCLFKNIIKKIWRHATWSSTWSIFSSYWRLRYSKWMTVLRRDFIGKLIVLSEITLNWRYWRNWEKRNHYVGWIKVSRNLFLRHAYFQNNAYLKVSQFWFMLIFEPCLFENRILTKLWRLNSVFEQFWLQLSPKKRFEWENHK